MVSKLAWTRWQGTGGKQAGPSFSLVSVSHSRVLICWWPWLGLCSQYWPNFCLIYFQLSEQEARLCYCSNTTAVQSSPNLNNSMIHYQSKLLWSEIHVPPECYIMYRTVAGVTQVKASLCGIIPQIVCLWPIGRVRAGAARQGVVAVLEDGLRHLAAPLDRAVQTLIPEMGMMSELSAGADEQIIRLIQKKEVRWLTWSGCRDWCRDMTGHNRCMSCQTRCEETGGRSSQHWRTGSELRGTVYL